MAPDWYALSPGEWDPLGSPLGHGAHRGRALQWQQRDFPSPSLRQGPLVPARSLSIHFAGSQSGAPPLHPLFLKLPILSIQIPPGILLGMNSGPQVPKRALPSRKCRAEQVSEPRRVEAAQELPPLAGGGPRVPEANRCRQASLHLAVFLHDQPRKIL